MVASLGRMAAAQTIPCGSASDSHAQLVLSGVKDVSSSLSPDDSTWRANAQVPLTSDVSNITLVASDSICTVAANAFAQLSGSYTTPHAVWVIAVGPTRYIVFDKARTSARRLLGAVFDTTFAWLADFLT